MLLPCFHMSWLYASGSLIQQQWMLLFFYINRLVFAVCSHLSVLFSSLQPIFMITSVIGKGDTAAMHKGSPYVIEFSIRSLCDLAHKYPFKHLRCVLEDNEQWKYNDEDKIKRLEITKFDGKEFTFTSQVIACMSGKLEYPQISLLKDFESRTDDKSKTLPLAKKNRNVSGRSFQKLSSSRRTSSNAAEDLPDTFALDEIVFSDLGRFVFVEETVKQVSVV